MSIFPPKNRLAPSRPPLELWGGIECTVARIGDQFRNQIRETGHYDRPDDIDRIAALGLRTLRYPVLWETIAPDRQDESSWTWHDRQLAQLREKSIAPIAGLVHHGSGPRYTNLLDPNFPELVAAHAARVAERYPWITLYTPINEPLTTARFSGLYGHWYPHGREQATFLRALITQCRAVVLSMRAIRAVNPAAQLLQTEDLGFAFSTPILRYQADYENQRRWLSLDLLCGMVLPHHPLYGQFIQAGIAASELAFFADGAGRPDIIGINHYLTSERFLDHRVRYYADFLRDYNGHHSYADVEAVRLDFPPGQTGPLVRLREAWQRYGLPVVMSEAHHGNSRDEQLRWLMECWHSAQTLRAEGADIRAVTVWSILGCVDWNTLLMQQNQFYEPGVFDVRSDPPRATALANAIVGLTAHGKYDHPVLDQPGWWRRDNRLHRPVASELAAPSALAPRRLVITGATGTLGQAFSRICDLRGLDHLLLTRADMDIADADSVRRVLQDCQPWAVINAAGYVRPEAAEQEPELCARENAAGAAVLAQACVARGIAYVTFSSDLVFDGKLGRSYVESDKVCPTGVYGASKVRAERQVLEAFPQALVIRSSAFFGPWDRYNFVYAALRDLASGKPVHASDEVFVSPTYIPDLVNETLDLLIDGAEGVWHLANQGTISWHQLITRVAQEAGLDTTGLRKAHVGPRRATALSSERSQSMPSLESAIHRFVRESNVAWQVDGTAGAIARE